MLLHEDGLPGSRLSPVWREGPHGGQRRAPHRPGKAPGAPGCGRVARRAPCHGLGRTRQTSALHGTPHHRRHCTPLEKKRKSRGQGRCAWEGRAVAARGSMASRHGAARQDGRGTRGWRGPGLPRARRAHGCRGSDTQRAVVREGGEHAAVSTAIEMYRAMDMAFWFPETEAALAHVERR